MMLTTLIGLGYLAANLSLTFVSEQTVIVMLMAVYAMLAFVMFHFIMDLHTGILKSMQIVRDGR